MKTSKKSEVANMRLEILQSCRKMLEEQTTINDVIDSYTGDIFVSIISYSQKEFNIHMSLVKPLYVERILQLKS
jgi:hypothetical protein